MVSVSSFKSSSKEHDVHLVNYGVIFLSEWWSGLCFHWEEDKNRVLWNASHTLTPEGAAFLQQEGSCCHYSPPCQDKHGQLKTFSTVSCFAFPAKWFSEIHSTATVLTGSALWGGILFTFGNALTNLVNQSCKDEEFKLSWEQNWKETLEWMFWSRVSVFPQWLSDHGCSWTGFLTDFTETLGCFHAVHPGNIKSSHLWKLYNCFMFS